MKIVKVWKDNYPWDVRVEKMCNTLISEGHDVHLLCRNTKNWEIREEINGLHIHRLPAIRNKLMNNICSLPTFFNPLWIYRLLKVVKKEKIDVILVRDLPLVLSGIFVGKICSIPVVFDMAENYPALWKDHVSRKGIRIYNYFLKNPGVAKILENYVLKKVDHVIVVVEESKIRILKKGIRESRLSIVSNTPDLDVFTQRDQEDNQIEQDKFNLLYVGFVTVGRGLDTILKSLQILKRKIKNIHFILVGDGKYLDELKISAKQLKVDEYVTFCGWVDFKSVPSYIRGSDICVVPHDITEHVNSTIPNKIFDYMASGKPVVVSDAAPLKRIVEENNCGVVFKSGDVNDFIEKVLELKDSAVRKQMGRNGFAAVRKKYNWINDSEVLKMVFEKICKDSNGDKHCEAKSSPSYEK